MDEKMGGKEKMGNIVGSKKIVGAFVKILSTARFFSWQQAKVK